MAVRLPAPTEEELAEAEAKIERDRVEREFEENRQRQQNARPKGAAKLSRTNAFRVTEPPLNRGPMPQDLPPDEDTGEETPAEILRRANNGEKPAIEVVPTKPKKKGKFDVPTDSKGEPLRTAATIIKGLGILYVEDRKADPVKAFETLRDSIMSNLDLLLPAMPQIKQMFELLQIGEPEREKESKNGKGESVADLTRGLRNFLQGDDE
jgi:hypothetical protein